MSPAVFRKKFPGGRIGRQSKDYGKTFICRRGCNTRTASYTDEFVWEDIYKGTVEDIESLVDLVKTGTKATRKRRQAKIESADIYNYGDDVDDGDIEPKGRGEDEEFRTPRKKTKALDVATTPTNKPKSASKLLTPSHRRQVPLAMPAFCAGLFRSTYANLFFSSRL